MPQLAIYLDCETTGLDPNIHGLIEFTAAIVNPSEGFVEIDRYVSGQIYVDPSFEVSPQALAVNGYDAGNLQLGRMPFEVASDFAAFLSRYNGGKPFTLLGQNVSFDEGFMKEFAERNSQNYSAWFSHRKIDVGAFLNARNLMTGKVGSSLKDACQEWGVSNLAAHTSDGDVTAGLEVARRIFATVNFASMVPPGDSIEREKTASTDKVLAELEAETIEGLESPIVPWVAVDENPGYKGKKKARNGENPNT